jgi:hypothetical protein
LEVLGTLHPMPGLTRTTDELKQPLEVIRYQQRNIVGIRTASLKARIVTQAIQRTQTTLRLRCEEYLFIFLFPDSQVCSNSRNPDTK